MIDGEVQNITWSSVKLFSHRNNNKKTYFDFDRLQPTATKIQLKKDVKYFT